MSIDAKRVKKLRDKTSAGMMDCKKALVESEGDFEKAVDHLRNSGIAKAEKKGIRETKDGLVHSYICLLYTSPSPRDLSTSRMPSSA